MDDLQNKVEMLVIRIKFKGNRLDVLINLARLDSILYRNREFNLAVEIYELRLEYREFTKLKLVSSNEIPFGWSRPKQNNHLKAI